MPWRAVDKEYRFEGPNGLASLLDLFEGRRQMIVYRAFAESGVTGWPASEQRLLIGRRPRMGWQMPWYTMTDGLDADFGVAEWHGTNAFIRDDDGGV
jgi:predicted dithiol-disulfide oxidoreductase (DUF899 family)